MIEPEAGEHESEVTAIPVEGPYAWLGAAGYLAVLAYPGRNEWKKRTEFVEAWRSCLIKHHRNWAISHGKTDDLPPIPEMKNQQIDNKIRAGVRRITRHRLPAADVMVERLLWETPDAARLFGAALELWAKRQGMENARITKITRPKGTISAAIGRRTECKVKVKSEVCDPFGVRSNIFSKSWTPSLPVIHLALALRSTLLKMAKNGGAAFDAFHLVVNPEWLPGTLEAAEVFRAVIEQKGAISRSCQVTLRPKPPGMD